MVEEGTPLTSDAVMMFLDTMLGLQVSIDPIYKSLAAEHPAWDAGHDVRLAVFSGIHQLLMSPRFSFMFYRQELLPMLLNNPSAGKQAFGRSRPNKMLFDYEKHISSGITDTLFHEVESTLRSILRAVAPGTCENGRATYESIYRSLFRTHLRNEPPNGIALLDLCRTVRNTNHNGGVFLPKSCRDLSLVYRDVTYAFKDGGVLAMSWELLFLLIKDLVDLLDTIMRDPVVAEYPNIIPHEGWDLARPNETERRVMLIPLGLPQAGYPVLNELLRIGREEAERDLRSDRAP